MSVTLGSNILSLRSQRHLSDASHSLEKSFQRLGSGLRINKASDDAAGLAIADTLRANSRIYTQGVRNLNDGFSLLSIADAAISQLSQIVTRQIELAEQAANGAYSKVQREALDLEAQSLSQEFFRISRSTKFNKLGLFDGAISALQFQGGIGVDGAFNLSLGGKLGTGTFDSRISNAVGGATYALTSADFNGDGAIDIISTNPTSSQLGVLIGRGDGTFQTVQNLSLGFTPRAITSGDFNGDGILDIAASNFSGNTLNIALGRGDGSFTAGVSILSTSAVFLEVADFNNDGKDDIVTSSSTSSSVEVHLGIGDGTFQLRRTFSVGANPSTLTVADFNSDGIMDISTAEAGGTVSVLMGTGGGSFAARRSFSIGGTPYSIDSGDLNNDGNIDLFITDFLAGNTSVILGNGDGSFKARATYNTDAASVFVTSGDLNGDGVIDLVNAHYGSARISVLIGNGDGSFNGVRSYAVGNQVRWLTLDDFNQDGVLDIAGVENGASSVGVLLGQLREGIAPILPFSLESIAEARQALPMLRTKLNLLSSQQGIIGAAQSRLEVAINVLQSSNDNYLLAESRIRDADIAEESSQATRLKILQEAASAVLALANKAPEVAIGLLTK